MMWLLLFVLTALVVLLPMVPALVEWHWPSDVTPLFIDKDDALDPAYLARSFAMSLATALALRQTHLGRSPITSLQPCKLWPFDARESAAATSHRVWDLHGDADLPAGMALLGEVAARGYCAPRLAAFTARCGFATPCTCLQAARFCVGHTARKSMSARVATWRAG